MPFYQSLSSHYDKIFPLNAVAFSFVSSYFVKGEKILDIGAGTGNLALALAEAGFEMTASEPDRAMMEKMKVKSRSKSLSLSIHQKSMEQLTEFKEQFDGIICVGNTLPHLQTNESIEHFVHDCHMKLNEGGKLILQTVSYEHVLSAEDFSFPVIEKEGFTFTRHYTVTKNKVLFTSKLTADGKTIENTIPLTPITSKELIPMMKEAGFKQMDVFGNFKGEPYTEQSKAFICIATK